MNKLLKKIKSEKSEFIDCLKDSTKINAADTLAFCETLKKNDVSDVIVSQLVKSKISAANYRSVCGGRSTVEFNSKLCIALEEIEESEYWFEIISDSNLSENLNEICRLRNEADERTGILSKAKNTTYSKK